MKGLTARPGHDGHVQHVQRLQSGWTGYTRHMLLALRLVLLQASCNFTVKGAKKRVP